MSSLFAACACLDFSHSL
jgi:predicted Holliday junction resolvase-like endonuclease